MAEEEGKEILPAQEQDTGLAVGDTILILGGALNKTVGKLYGFASNRFSVLPNGSSNRLTHIRMEDGEPDAELGIQEILVLKKAIRPGFVNMIELFPELQVETFDKDGNPGPKFQVKSVNEAQDSAVLVDEAGVEENYEFSFTGIPQDLPFEMMRVRESPKGPPTEGYTGDNRGQQLHEEKRTNVEVDEDDLAEGDGQVDAEPTFVVLEDEIELPMLETLEEKTSSELLFPDFVQRSEMLSQLIRMLPQARQKNPKELKLVRRFVETLMTLRNEVVKYGETGDPTGINPTTVTTLGELMNQPNVYLAKKVAQMSKVIYLDHTIEQLRGEEENQNPYFVDANRHLFAAFSSDLITRAAELENEANMEFMEGQFTELPHFYNIMEKYRQQIQTPYIQVQGTKATDKDEDVLRFVTPELDNNKLEVLTPLITEDGKLKRLKEPLTTKAHFATARLLKERHARFSKGEPLRVIESADAPAYTNMLLFPRSTLRDLGPIRSGRLVQDVSLGLGKPKLMEDILEELGDIDDFPTAGTILNLGMESMIGNVTVKDWLQSQNLKLEGIGDVYRMLLGYGVQNIEWNEEQIKIFQEKIEHNLASLKAFMNKQREENASLLSNLKYEPQTVLTPEASERLKARIQAEPLLQKVVEQIQEFMGDLANVDINWFSYVFLQYPDLVLAVLGQQPDIVVRERNRYQLKQYLQAVRNAFLHKRLVKESGTTPIVNECPHVASLQKIRKIGSDINDSLRMKSLLQFLAKFRGQTRENWVWCNKCNQHLICGHELLQIQEFARPREQEVLHKEILLKFSGGVFSGKNICRECGQGISDLDFDTSLEYDDEGRPMMGRAVLEDEDEKIEDLYTEKDEQKDESGNIDFESDKLNEMYKTFRKIANEVGINPERNDYDFMLTQMKKLISTIPSPEQHRADMEKEKAEGRRMIPYDVMYSIKYISGCVAILLLNVQTRIPDYTSYYTNANCREGFFGWPLEEGEKRHGLQCINRVAASINDKVFPWNVSPLRKTADVNQRADILLKRVIPAIEHLLKDDAIQFVLQQKREYHKKIFGDIGNVKRDQIEPNFRPIPYMITKEEAAEEQILPTAATPNKTAEAWIRSAHGLVRKEAEISETSPFALTTCCRSQIQTPGGYWMSEEVTKVLPPLEPRALGLPPFRSHTIEPTFKTEKPETLSGEIDESEYYKLFLKVCYQGERKGLEHEFGFTLTCSHCGLNVPQNPKLPLTDLHMTAKEYTQELQQAEAKLRAHLEAQGIDFTKEFFDELLHTAQQKAKVTMEPIPRILLSDQTVSVLKGIPLRPLVNWVEKLDRLQVSLNEIGNSPSVEQIAIASDEILSEVRDKEDDIKSRITPKMFAVLENMIQRPSRDCAEAIRTFLLTPFMRWISKVKSNNFKILKTYELQEDAEEDIMIKGLGNHLLPLASGKEVPKGAHESKVRAFITELRILCNRVLPFLRSFTTPGGAQMIDYLIHAYVIGIVHHFMDPTLIPPSEDVDYAALPDFKLLYDAFVEALVKFERGSKVPTEDQIRTVLEIRAEQELQVKINNQERMTREQRQLMKVKKTLGIGEFAIGGTDKIREYNPEMYRLWAGEREQATLVLGDVPGTAGGQEEGYDTYVNNVDD
jgi:hypothetical protein